MSADHGFVRSLDESFQDTLAPGSLIVGAAYILIGIIHYNAPVEGHPLLGQVEFTLGLATLGLHLFCRGRRFSVTASRVIGAAVVAPVLFNNGLYLNLYPEPRHAFGFYILLVGIGMIPFTGRWFASLAGVTLSLWGLSVLRSTAPLTAYAEPGVTILAMAALGTALHVWRFRYAERMDHLRENALRADEERSRIALRYRDMTENANDMITELDAEGNVLYANPAHEVILGFKPDFLIGRSCRGFFLTDDDDLAEVFAGPPHKRVVVMPHAAGGERTIECSLRPFELPNGEKRLVITTRDVTERVASERALEEGRVVLEARLEERTVALDTSVRELQRAERLASMGTLAAGIAHQINNPVGSIQMSSELALISKNDEDANRIFEEALVNNLEQAKRCGQIVSSMLQFARNEPTVKSSQDLAQIVLRVCGQTESYAKKSLSIIDAEDVRGPLPVSVSAIEIEQALLNIVRNATESSAESVRVGIAARAEGDVAIVTITDDGDGMSPTEVEHAFDPFYTTRLNRGGTGLGLSVAHGVLTDHGGTLSIESDVGKGTTFTIRLPIERKAVS